MDPIAEVPVLEVPETSTIPEIDEGKPRVVPFLTSNLPPPHPQTAASTFDNLLDGVKKVSRQGETAWEGKDARRGLEDRLRVLRDVDEVLWGLMGELVKVKSRWEAEDGKVEQHETTGDSSEL